MRAFQRLRSVGPDHPASHPPAQHRPFRCMQMSAPATRQCHGRLAWLSCCRDIAVFCPRGVDPSSNLFDDTKPVSIISRLRECLATVIESPMNQRRLHHAAGNPRASSHPGSDIRSPFFAVTPSCLRPAVHPRDHPWQGEPCFFRRRQILSIKTGPRDSALARETDA